MTKWFGVASLVLLLGAGVAYLTALRPSGEGGLVVEQPDRNVGDCTTDEPIYLEFRVVNPGPRTLRIVGFNGV